jgi:hypothetical protein
MPHTKSSSTHSRTAGPVAAAVEAGGTPARKPLSSWICTARTATPEALVHARLTFDLANDGGSVVMENFISAGGRTWLRRSGAHAARRICISKISAPRQHRAKNRTALFAANGFCPQ